MWRVWSHCEWLVGVIWELVGTVWVIVCHGDQLYRVTRLEKEENEGEKRGRGKWGGCFPVEHLHFRIRGGILWLVRA